MSTTRSRPQRVGRPRRRVPLLIVATTLEPSHIDALDKRADAEGISRACLLRRIIRDALRGEQA